jgi:hypothetical protein
MSLKIMFSGAISLSPLGVSGQISYPEKKENIIIIIIIQLIL